jgi:hypothetical protein
VIFGAADLPTGLKQRLAVATIAWEAAELQRRRVA